MKNKVILALGIGLAAVLAPSIPAEAAIGDLQTEMNVDDLDDYQPVDEISTGVDANSNGILEKMEIERKDNPNVDPSQPIVANSAAPVNDPTAPNSEDLLVATITQTDVVSQNNVAQENIQTVTEQMEAQGYTVQEPVADEKNSKPALDPYNENTPENSYDSEEAANAALANLDSRYENPKVVPDVANSKPALDPYNENTPGNSYDSEEAANTALGKLDSRYTDAEVKDYIAQEKVEGADHVYDTLDAANNEAAKYVGTEEEPVIVTPVAYKNGDADLSNAVVTKEISAETIKNDTSNKYKYDEAKGAYYTVDSVDPNENEIRTYYKIVSEDLDVTVNGNKTYDLSGYGVIAQTVKSSTDTDTDFFAFGTATLTKNNNEKSEGSGVAKKIETNGNIGSAASRYQTFESDENIDQTWAGVVASIKKNISAIETYDEINASEVDDYTVNTTGKSVVKIKVNPTGDSFTFGDVTIVGNGTVIWDFGDFTGSLKASGKGNGNGNGNGNKDITLGVVFAPGATYGQGNGNGNNSRNVTAQIIASTVNTNRLHKLANVFDFTEDVVYTAKDSTVDKYQVSAPEIKKWRIIASGVDKVDKYMIVAAGVPADSRVILTGTKTETTYYYGQALQETPDETPDTPDTPTTPATPVTPAAPFTFTFAAPPVFAAAPAAPADVAAPAVFTAPAPAAAAAAVLGEQRSTGSVLGARRDADTADASGMAGWLSAFAASTSLLGTWTLCRKKREED